jgi:hypothetical protein
MTILMWLVVGYMAGVGTCLGVWFAIDRAGGSPRWY